MANALLVAGALCKLAGALCWRQELRVCGKLCAGGRCSAFGRCSLPITFWACMHIFLLLGRPVGAMPSGRSSVHDGGILCDLVGTGYGEAPPKKTKKKSQNAFQFLSVPTGPVDTHL